MATLYVEVKLEVSKRLEPLNMYQFTEESLRIQKLLMLPLEIFRWGRLGCVEALYCEVDCCMLGHCFFPFCVMQTR